MAPMQPNLDDVIAVVLAGGYGTRIKHLLPNLPKPMAPVAGKPFVEWVVRYLGVQGIKKVILSTGYLAEVVEEHFKQQPVSGVEVFCYPETTALGTAGGFLNAARQVSQPPAAWLVLNGDSLVFADLKILVDYLREPNTSGAVVGLQVADAFRYGSMLSDETGKLICFQEKRPGAGTINAGVYLLRHSLIEEFPSGLPLSFEAEVFPSLLAKGVRLMVESVKPPFLDIGTPESLPQAEAFIVKNFEEFAGL
jgi:D-glycero-alpha-D-manno-heptose 1-phosphate guanylyltransferase